MIDTRSARSAASDGFHRAADILRLAFLACYVMSATVSQIAMGALVVYLISG